jgi:hypothetical protein
MGSDSPSAAGRQNRFYQASPHVLEEITIVIPLATGVEIVDRELVFYMIGVKNGPKHFGHRRDVS